MHSAGPREVGRDLQTLVPGFRRGLEPLLAQPTATGQLLSLDTLGGSDFPVSDQVGLQDLAQTHERPAVAYNPADDQYLVVWQGFKVSTGWDIYAQRVSANGTLVGQTLVVFSAGSDQKSPDVVYNPTSAEYLVVWHDSRSGQHWDIYGQRVTGNGVITEESILIAGGTNDQGWPRIAANSKNGEYLIVWHERRRAVSEFDVCGRLLDSQGDAVDMQFDIADDPNDQTFPSVAYDHARNEYLVVWETPSPLHPTEGDLYARRLSAAGTTLDYKFVVSAADSDQYLPDVAYDSASAQYLVVWEDHRRRAARSGIWGQMISGVGTKQGPEITVSEGGDHLLAPRIACNPGAGEYLVVWEDDTTGSGNGFAYGQRVEADGHLSGNPLALSADGANYQTAVAAAGGDPDGWMVVWQDGRIPLGDEIRGQYVDTDGDILSVDLAIAGASHGQQRPDIAFGGSATGYLAVWMDYRNGSEYAIFGQRLESDGTLVDSNVELLSRTYSVGAPQIAYNSVDDEYLIVAHSLEGAGGFDILGQRVGPDGVTRGEPTILSGSTVSGDEGFPSVAYGSQRNEYLVAWHAFTAGSWNVHAQRVTANGSTQGNGLTICNAHHEQSYASVAYNPADDEYLVTWQDKRDGDQYDTYVRRVAGDGTLPGAANRVSESSLDDRFPDVVYDRDFEGYLIAWERVDPDDPAAGSDINARWVSADGQPVGSGFSVCATPADQTEVAVTYVPAVQEYLVVWRDESLTADGGDVYAQRISRQTGMSGSAFAVTAANGYQALPALCAHSQTAQVIALWQDHRDRNWDIYGRKIGLPAPMIYLPFASK